jgi:hypothetical protein
MKISILSPELPGTLLQDIDACVPLSIAVNEKSDPGLKEAIEKAEAFLDIPPDNPGSSSRWQTKDRALKVELLTPLVG